MRLRPILTTTAKFAVAVGLIWFLINKGLLDPAALKQLLAPKPLILGLFIVGVTLFLQAWRWQILLTLRGFQVSIWQANRLYLIGTFFNYALPGAVGGDIVKAFYLVRDYPNRKMEAVLTVIIDRMLGLYTTLALAVFAIGFDWKVVNGNTLLRTLSYSTIGAFLFMTLFWITAFSKRLHKLVQLEIWLHKLPMGLNFARAYKAAQSYGAHRKAFALTLLISFVALLLGVLFMRLVGYTVGEDRIAMATYLFAVPLGYIASSLPLSPAGIGVGQFAFLALFRMHSGIVDTQIGQIAMTAYQATLLAWGLVGAVFYLLQRRVEPIEATPL